MKVYNYDEITKEYLYSEDAYLDPMASKEAGKDIYFTPANATTITPPTALNGFVQVFVNNAWDVVRDYRGKWQLGPTGEMSQIDYIGDVKEGYAILSEQQYQKQLEEPKYYVVIDGLVVVNPDWANIEQERLARTYMTKWDFVKYVLNPHKFTYAMLKEVLAKDIALEEAWECCSAIYRGDETLCTNLPKLLPTVTTAFLDEAFKTYGNYGGTNV